MPFFTSLATSAYGPATNNGNGEAAHSPGTRLLLRCRVGRTSASRGSREGSHRSQLYSRRKRGFLFRDCADGGQIARPADQYKNRPAVGLAQRRPRLGMDIKDYRERTKDICGIGGHRVWEYHLPKRQGHARTRLSAHVARNHVQGLHRMVAENLLRQPAVRRQAVSSLGAAPARREMDKRLNMYVITRSYMRGGIS
jgi:hypothetical protein